MLTAYPSPGKRKGMRICTAFARGCNGKVAPEGSPKLDDGPAFFYGWTEHSVPLIRRCIAEGRDWYYADNAYYYGRGLYFRVTKNALMHDGSGEGDRNRMESFGIEFKPWQTSGHHIVIASQSELFYRHRLNVSRETWTAQVIAELRRHTKREIVVCHKPEARASNNAAVHPGFEEALKDAHALIVHSSSAAVKAIAEGVPVFALAPCMVSGMALDDLSEIEAPYYPENRKRWMRVLMANQWTTLEMKLGHAWRDLRGVAPVKEAWQPESLAV